MDIIALKRVSFLTALRFAPKKVDGQAEDEPADYYAAKVKRYEELAKTFPCPESWISIIESLESAIPNSEKGSRPAGA